jgi:peroxiredoxin
MKILIILLCILYLIISSQVISQTNPQDMHIDSSLTIDNQNNDYELSTILKPGAKVQDFSIETIEGKTIKLSELKGKMVFINFFTLSCPSCMKELPVIEKEIWQKYKDNKNIVILIVGREEPVVKLKEFRDNKQFTFPMASDNNRKAYSLFATQYVPRNLIIDKDGTLLMTEVGFTEEKSKELILKIQELLDKK